MGVLLYEIMVGIPPFRDSSQDLVSILRQILANNILFPENFPTKAKDLILKLMKTEPQERLGAFDMQDLKNHKFFKDIDW